MSQVTYTVGLLNPYANIVYSGSLVVHLNATTDYAEGAKLSLSGVAPLALTAAKGNEPWSFSGSNSALDVSTLLVYGEMASPGSVPSYIAGSITLAVSGQAKQDLLLLGYQAGPAAAPPGDGTVSANVSTDFGVTLEYDFSLQLLNTSFGAAGSGTFTGFGVETREEGVLGPMCWLVAGALTLNGGTPITIQCKAAWGNSDFWVGTGSASDGTAISLAFVSPSSISGSANGTVTVGSETSFFIGTGTAAPPPPP